MAKDVVPELLETIEADFAKRYANSDSAKRVRELIEAGKATYQEANDYAIEVGELLAGVFKANLSSSVLPDGRMYYNIAERILNATLGHNHDLIATAAAQIQTGLNKAAKLGIKGLKPTLNQDRIDGLIERVSAEEHYDDIAWILDEPVVNFSQSVVDDAIHTNADFHYQSGLKPRIIRTAMENCCKWCANLAGTYDYEDVSSGSDVWRRHRVCRCIIEYDPGDGRRRGVRSTKSPVLGEEKKKEARREFSESAEIISETRKTCLKLNIAYNGIRRASGARTEEEIIDYLGGGDLTKGSCSSAAFAYVGNKGGYDVTDFRGGASQDVFSRGQNIRDIAQLPGVRSVIVEEYNDFTAARKMTQTMVEGREYYMTAGKHAAIVRKIGKQVEYLELQSPASNGFKPLDENALRYRFACQRSHTIYRQKMKVRNVLIDIDSLQGNSEFERLLGFINTVGMEQKKGVRGGLK